MLGQLALIETFDQGRFDDASSSSEEPDGDALDVESVNARIDYETAHLQEVQAYLSARRDRRVDLLNLGNLFIGGGVGAVGSGLQLISSAEHARNVVSTSAGFGGTETAKRTIALT